MANQSSGSNRFKMVRWASAEHKKPVLSTETASVHDFYNLGRKLGEGHFGATFECSDKDSGKHYAMKRLSKARLLMLGTPLEEVQREVGMLYHLQGHPNIVEIVDAFEDNRFVYIIMELCRGGELYDRIVDKGGYCERDAARLVQTIVSVINYCHSLGVVHRDLKPENFLFLDPSEESPLKAIDFGLSIFFKQGEPITSGMAGSPLYLAPEMVETHGQSYTEAVDVWSAGVIMYMLLSGYCPFPTDLPTMDDLFGSIINDVIDYKEDPWPKISREAKDLLQGMLCREPGKRLTATQVLAHPWLSKSGVAPSTPMDPTVISRLRSYAKLTRFRKLATRIVAQHMSEEQILGMKEIFRQLDTDHSGTITLDEMHSGLKKMGASVCETELEDIFSAADADHSNAIDMDEFFAATLGLHRLIKEENLAFAFEYMDKDGSGYISIDELRQACEEFGFSTNDLEGMFAELDANHDKKIDYKEFMALMHRQHSQSQDWAKSHSIGKDKSFIFKFESRTIARSHTC